MRFLLSAVAATLLVSGCAGPIRVPPVPANGTVAGHVTSVGCPGPQRPGQVCSRPLPDAHVRFAGLDGNQASATAISDGAGAYSLRLPAGDYSVSIPEQRPVPVAPARVTVQAGLTVTHDITVDNGMR